MHINGVSLKLAEQIANHRSAEDIDDLLQDDDRVVEEIIRDALDLEMYDDQIDEIITRVRAHLDHWSWTELSARMDGRVAQGLGLI